MSGIIKKGTISDRSLFTIEDLQGANLFLQGFRMMNLTPSLDALVKIITAFQNIPYENLSKILVLRDNLNGKIHMRTPLEVVEGYFTHRLGGTCFSLTRTLWAILKVIGVESYPVMGHMRAGRNEHCALIAVLNEKKYLIDPGYILSYPFPIERLPTKQFRTHFNVIELQYAGNSEYNLFTIDKSGKKWRYSFSAEATPWKDFYRFWEESFHRRTMHGLCLSKLTSEGMVYLHKDFFQRTSHKGREKGYIQGNIAKVIKEIFRIPETLVDKAHDALEETLRWDFEHGYYKGKRGKK